MVTKAQSMSFDAWVPAEQDQCSVTGQRHTWQWQIIDGCDHCADCGAVKITRASYANGIRQQVEVR